MENNTITVKEFRDYLRIQSEKNKILLTANIEITSACCFKCPHCYMYNSNNYMSLESFKRIIKQLKLLGCLYLTLTGGEALLHPQFKEIYISACKAGFIVTVFSNGYLLNKYINLFTQYRPYEIDITLYGINNKTYKSNTGILDGEKVFQNLKLLKKNNITFSLKAAVTKNIYPNLDQMKLIADSFEVTFRFDLYIYLNKEQAQHVARLEPNEIVDILMKNDKYVELEKNEMLKHQLCKHDNCYTCHPGESNLYITWDEYAKMCPFTSFEHSINIQEGEKTIQEARKLLATKSNEYISKKSLCYKCKYITTCRRCPERFFIETGSYDTPSKWMCETAKSIFEKINKDG